MISYKNNNGRLLIKLYDCTWTGLKSRDSDGMELTAGHYYLYLDIFKNVYTYSSTCPQMFHIQKYTATDHAQTLSMHPTFPQLSLVSLGKASEKCPSSNVQVRVRKHCLSQGQISSQIQLCIVFTSGVFYLVRAFEFILSI